jgi:hypothetical protein
VRSTFGGCFFAAAKKKQGPWESYFLRTADCCTHSNSSFTVSTKNGGHREFSIYEGSHLDHILLEEVINDGVFSLC